MNRSIHFRVSDNWYQLALARAKELGIKERTFTEWLIQKNLCYRDKKRKIKPYANKMKYFELTNYF